MSLPATDCPHCTAAAARPWGQNTPGCHGCAARELARSPQAHQAFVAKRTAILHESTKRVCAALDIPADEDFRSQVKAWWAHDHRPRAES